MVNSKPPPSLATGDGSRLAEIVMQSAQLFDAKGYHQTSMSDVASSVGLQKPTLYHYVTGKDEILFLIHKQFIELLLEKQRRRAEASLSSRHCLHQIMSDLLELVETHPGHVRTFFEHYRELPEERQREIREKSEAYRELVEDVIRSGTQSGEFRDVDPTVTAMALFGMCNWAYQWFDPSGPYTSREVAYMFNEFLLQGIGGRTADQ